MTPVSLFKCDFQCSASPCFVCCLYRNKRKYEGTKALETVLLNQSAIARDYPAQQQLISQLLKFLRKKSNWKFSVYL